MPVGVPRVCGLLAPTTTMGRQRDDEDRRMTAASGARKRAWRALTAALAGGGLTAVGLGPLSGGALAAENWSGSEAEGTGTTPTETTPSEKPTTTGTTPTTT